jgi:hypothetical protein
MFVLPKTLDANVNNPTTFSVGGRKKKTHRKRKTNRKRQTTKKSKRL